MRSPAISLMADIGEGFGAYSMGDDLALLDIITSANIACGFHAGDPVVMDRVVRTCAELGVSIGAHPGFQDLRGFGRRTVVTSPEELRCDVLYQVGALQAFARAVGGELSHVTPHGRLGNLVMTSSEYADPVLDALESLSANLPVATGVGCLAELARKRGMDVAVIGFADRAYRADGTLVPRTKHGAVLQDEGLIAERAVRMATESSVETIDGQGLSLTCDTVLLHGDSPGAVKVAERVRAALEKAGVRLVSVPDVIERRRTRCAG